jgi:hypothetical protein
VFGQICGRIAGRVQYRQRPLALLPDRRADDPMQLLAGRMERCYRTPRQPGNLGQINLLVQRHGHSPFADGGDDLGRHVQVDLFRLAAWPLYDLDLPSTSLRSFQYKRSDGRSMAGDLPIPSRPLPATEEEEPLFVPGRLNCEVEKLMLSMPPSPASPV